MLSSPLSPLDLVPRPQLSKTATKPPHQFESYYLPLAALVRRHSLQGLDLDIEEPIPLTTISRLLRRLRADFGPSFLISLAPVATALLGPAFPHLSGFSHFELEAAHAPLVDWYNTQLYNNWGDASSTAWYDAIVAAGWRPERVVLGVVTNPGNGAGHVTLEALAEVCRVLRARYPGFGGVMGWEYFNSGMERGEARGPWEWAGVLGRCVRGFLPASEGEDGRVVGSSGGMMGQVPVLPQPSVQWPSEDVEKLVVLGFGRFEAVAALNATEGNVEMAAGLLFGE